MAEARRPTTDIPLTLHEAARALRAGELTSVELTAACIARADALDDQLGCYLARFDEEALAAAAAADERLAAGRDDGPLQGIPIGVKDILATTEGPTTANSLVHDPAWGAGRDAPVITRLRAAGAVITGKVTTMEFAIGMPDFAKPFPIPRNPWDPAAWPGGSSSGTGNGVAAGFFLAGLGTDTGGSIRIPAAYCGVSGLMPTFGRVPKSGCVPLGFTLDHIGPLARGAWDCAAVLQVLAGADPSDPNSVDVPVPDYHAGIDGGVEGLTVGVMREHHFNDPDPGTEAAFDAAIAQLRDLGATVVDVSIPYYQEVTAASLVTMASEAMAYHRNDLCERWDDYFARTRELVVWGVLASGADYVQAQRVRRVGQRALAGVLRGVDVIATPTASTGAPLYERINSEGGMGTFGSIHTPYWDAVGNPVLAVPMGFTDAGMPVSLQLAGRPFDESTLLRVGHAYQCATDWHLRVPDLVSSVAEGGGGPVTDEEIVRAKVAAAGLCPSEAETATLVTAYAGLRGMLEMLYAVDEARYGDPCLTFAADPRFVDWS
ncbi:MAG TPA: amidase [Acidimicrobiia bacterium]|nr:amidase [Acidimicrobiia bacterium]